MRNATAGGLLLVPGSEGRICSGASPAPARHTACPACGIHRLLPARLIETPPAITIRTVCRLLPGVGDFTCTRCGQEGWHHHKGICGRCVLGDRLSAHLDDGTGRVRPELAPLYDRVVADAAATDGDPVVVQAARSAHPGGPGARAGSVDSRRVVHADPAAFRRPHPGPVDGLGVLPARDRHLLLFEQWLDTWLAVFRMIGKRCASRPNSDHGCRRVLVTPNQVLRQYATWHILRGLRKAADRGPIGHYRDQRARHQLRVAAQFLERLHARGLQLIQCSQSDVDAWFAAATFSSKETLRPFLVWAIRTHHMRRMRLPLARQMPPRPISLRDRVELLRRVASGLDMDLTERVIATLVLLYAQPLSRIVRLTVDDVLTDPEGRVLIRLGDPPAPIPSPFDDIVRSHLRARHNLHTATNPNSTWLFPGRRAGQPIHPTSIRLRLTTLGIPNMPVDPAHCARCPSSTTCGRGQHAWLPRRQSRNHRRRDRCYVEAIRRRHS